MASSMDFFFCFHILSLSTLSAKKLGEVFKLQSFYKFVSSESKYFSNTLFADLLSIVQISDSRGQCKGHYFLLGCCAV